MLSELETPLVGLQADDRQPLVRGSLDTVQLTELSEVSLVNLRVDPSDRNLMAALRTVLGLDLPVQPNTVTEGQDCTALWLAPDEWLLRSATDIEWVGRIQQALGAAWYAVTDQTSGYSVVQLQGPHACDVLNAGCPLDLHSRVLTQGQCAQSHFFKTSVLLRPLTRDGQAWEFIVRRSFADYAVRMLLDAMQG